jgi:ubiquitin C-terminal hydrolase
MIEKKLKLMKYWLCQKAEFQKFAGLEISRLRLILEIAIKRFEIRV